MPTAALLALAWLLVQPATSPAAASPAADALTRYDLRAVTFDRPDGPYTADATAADFGNGKPAAGRDFGQVVSGALRVSYRTGQKVHQTGFSAQPRLAPRTQYTLSYRIRYDRDFEPGLHGKQLGLSGGAGYDGGRGQQARDNGDGWSVRLQFDAHAENVTNQLYVYHSQMPGKYGDSLGTNKIRFPLERGRWHDIRLRVTMQSSADAADGRIEVWQDGQLRFDVADVRFVTKESGRVIDRLRLEMFNGGGGIVPTRDSFLEIDDLRWE